MARLELYQFGLFLQEVESAPTVFEKLKALDRFMPYGREVEERMWELYRLKEGHHIGQTMD